MQNKYKTIIVLIVIIILSLFSLKTLYHSGFYTSHDGWHQVARLYHFDQAIRDGQFPPRWSGTLLHNFGYPLFIFSYHMPWLIAEPFVLLGMNVFDAIKLVFLLTYLLSGLSIYLWISEMWGKKAGLMSVFVYLWIPYRFANIFVRANIGESVSFAFIPLVFWALFKLHKKINMTPIIIGSVGIAGFMLSHVMVVFLFAVTGLGYFLVLLKNTKVPKRLFILWSVITAILGIGLSSYYLLPAFYYKRITVFVDLYHGLYKNYFTPLSKLIYSSWGYTAVGLEGEMSRQVGFIVLFAVGVSIILLLYSLLFRKKNKPLLSDYTAGVFIISFLFSFFMMLKASSFIWKLFESQALIDFPFRFLAVTTVSGAVLVGYCVHKVSGKLQYLLIALMLIITFYNSRNYLRVNQYTDIPLSLYISSELTTNTDDEYLPKWVDRNYARDENAKFISDNEVQIAQLQQKTNSISFDYTLSHAASVDIHQMFFDGWTGKVDNKKILILKGSKGGMSLNLPAGTHTVSLNYVPTGIMRIGEIVTFVSCAAILIFSLYLRRKFK